MLLRLAVAAYQILSHELLAHESGLASIEGADHVRVGFLELWFELFVVLEGMLEDVSTCDSIKCAESCLLEEH